jgi:hypothetical protein
MQKTPPTYRRMTEKERADHDEWQGVDKPRERKKDKRERRRKDEEK